MLAILIITNIITLSLLIFAGVLLWRAGKILMLIEDNIQKSCDVLDSSYLKISEIANTPILFDSPEIRGVLEEIKSARTAVLFAANNITTNNIEEA